MLKLRGGTNPFYVLLLVAGVAFSITACAYGVMAFRQARVESEPLSPDDTSLMAVLDRRGVWILGVELLLLGVLTVAAIATDQFWEKRDQQPAGENQTVAAAPTVKENVG